MGTQQKKKKRTKDNRAVVSEIKRTQDLDANRLALQPTFEGTAYSTIGAGTISFCNVTTSIVTALQGVNPPGDVTPPAQVTGLTVGSPSGSSLSLSWTANTEPDLANYNVYRGTTAGFTVTPGATSPTGSPVTNSFVDSGLNPSTTYYYRVLAEDTSDNLGTLSTEANGTTTAAAPAAPSLWAKFDNSLADSSGNSNSIGAVSGFAYSTTAKFGSHSMQINYVTTTTQEYVTVINSSSTALDLTTGFSLSLWYYMPSDHGQTNTSLLAEKFIDNNNRFELWVSHGSGNLRTAITKSGVTYNAQVIGVPSLGVWHHVVVTFNGATNTTQIYLDKVTGSALGGTLGAPTSNNWIFGQHLVSSADTTTTFRGRLDEIQYFKGVVLTSTQVTNLFNTNAP